LESEIEDPVGGFPALEQKIPKRLGAQDDVVKNTEIIGQGEMLVDHPQTRIDRSLWGALGQDFPGNLDFSRICDVMPEEDVHQSRFSCSVFAEQGQDFPSFQGKRNIMIGMEIPELFVDAL
jgi:hypothetical protein